MQLTSKVGGGYSKGHPISPSKPPVQQLGHKPLPRKERTKSLGALLPLLIHESYQSWQISPTAPWVPGLPDPHLPPVTDPASFLHSQILLWARPISPAHPICFISPALVECGCLEKPAHLSGITQVNRGQKEELEGHIFPQAHRCDINQLPALACRLFRQGVGGRCQKRTSPLPWPHDNATFIFHCPLEKARLL